MSDSPEPSPRLRFAGPLAIAIGGAVAGVGCWLTWFRVINKLSGRTKIDIQTGIRNIDGQVLFAFALIALTSVVLMLYKAARTRYTWLGAVALIAGLFIVGVGTFDATTPEQHWVDAASAKLASDNDIPKAQAVFYYTQSVRRGVVSVNPRLGIFLVVGGGGAAVLGSAATLLIARRIQEPEAPEEEGQPEEGEPEEADSDEFDSEEFETEDEYSEQGESEGAESEEAKSVYDSE